MSEVINIPVENKPEDQQHIQDMVNKVNGTPVPGGEEKLWADKYKTEEDLIKGIIESGKGLYGNSEEFYKELQRQHSKKAEETKKGTPAESPKIPEKVPEVPATALNIDQYTKEFQESGKLSEESYKDLEKKGIPRVMVDGYIQGMEAAAAKKSTAIEEVVGGAEKLSEMIQWAAANMTQQEKELYNKAIDGSVEEAVFAAQGLLAKYSKSNPQLILGGGTSVAPGDVYESWQQVQNDMKTEKYKTDSAERNRVAEKLKRSKL